VLAGGVVSAVFGAEVAKWSRDLFEPVRFAGCYALIPFGIPFATRSSERDWEGICT